MTIYAYIVHKDQLTDVALECLQGGSDVLSSLPPRQLRTLFCADFQFPTGDSITLLPEAIDLTSAIAID